MHIHRVWVELTQVRGLMQGCFGSNIFVELITHPFAHEMIFCKELLV